MITTLDALLPGPAYRISSSRLVDAPPDVVWRELLALPMSALPIGSPLTAVRHLPDVLARRERRRRRDRDSGTHRDSRAQYRRAYR